MQLFFAFSLFSFLGIKKRVGNRMHLPAHFSMFRSQMCEIEFMYQLLLATRALIFALPFGHRK